MDEDDASHNTNIDEDDASQNTDEDIATLSDGVMSDDDAKQKACIIKLRRRLSIPRDLEPTIQEVIDTGVLPRLVELLLHVDPEMQIEAAWVLTNVASGTSYQARAVIDVGAVPILVHLLSSVHLRLKEQACWALGNIAGDCVEFRDIVTEAGALPNLFTLIHEHFDDHEDEDNDDDDDPYDSYLELMRNASWLLSNLFRNTPRPSMSYRLSVIPVLRKLLFSKAEGDQEVTKDALWAMTYITDVDPKEDTDDMEALLVPSIFNDFADRYFESGRCRRSNIYEAPILEVLANLTRKENILRSLIDSSLMEHLCSRWDLFFHAGRITRNPSALVYANIINAGNMNVERFVNFNLKRVLCTFVAHTHDKNRVTVLNALKKIVKEVESEESQRLLASYLMESGDYELVSDITQKTKFKFLFEEGESTDVQYEDYVGRHA